jgi:hypothetical protein
MKWDVPAFEIAAWNTNRLIAIKKLQQDHDPLGPKRRYEDALQWRQWASNDLKVFAGSQVMIGVQFRGFNTARTQMLDDALGHRRRTMIEFDNSTDAAGRTYGRPIVVTAEADKQIPGEQRFQPADTFSAYHAFTHQLRVKYHIVLLKQVEVGALILPGFALQKVPIRPVGTLC